MPILENVPTPIVFDHLAHIPQPEGVKHPLFGQVLALIDKGKTWVKLSGAYADTKVGPPTYADATTVAQAYAKRAPERCVWGSDWPHTPGHDAQYGPDVAGLYRSLHYQTVVDDFTRAVGSDTLTEMIMTDNPARLYGFGH